MPEDAAPLNDKLPLLPKRKKFLIPIIILLALTLVGLVAGVGIGMMSVQRSAAFEITLAELEHHPAVKQHVGLPFEPTWRARGFHDERNGRYELQLEIKGPAGKAGVIGLCERETDDEPWRVTQLKLLVGGRDGSSIHLVGDPDWPANEQPR